MSKNEMENIIESYRYRGIRDNFFIKENLSIDLNCNYINKIRKGV
ncbi:MAG: hypothetical protein ACRC41_18450 [Sarcina sp.]